MAGGARSAFIVRGEPNYCSTVIFMFTTLNLSNTAAYETSTDGRRRRRYRPESFVLKAEFGPYIQSSTLFSLEVPLKNLLQKGCG